VYQTHISVFPEQFNLDKMQLIVILLVTWELLNKIIRLSGKNKLYWLWERLPAAIILFRGWKPLPQGFFYGSLDFPDKRLK